MSLVPGHSARCRSTVEVPSDQRVQPLASSWGGRAALARCLVVERTYGCTCSGCRGPRPVPSQAVWSRIGRASHVGVASAASRLRSDPDGYSPGDRGRLMADAVGTRVFPLQPPGATPASCRSCADNGVWAGSRLVPPRRLSVGGGSGRYSTRPVLKHGPRSPACARVDGLLRNPTAK